MSCREATAGTLLARGSPRGCQYPPSDAFADLPPLSMYFYDGAECLRPLDQSPKAAKRPRGYSCEELGGLAWGWDAEFPKLSKISVDFPLFLSPHATGCSRYASAIFLGDGSLLGAWQQAQPDGSQAPGLQSSRQSRGRSHPRGLSKSSLRPWQAKVIKRRESLFLILAWRLESLNSEGKMKPYLTSFSLLLFFFLRSTPSPITRSPSERFMASCASARRPLP